MILFELMKHTIPKELCMGKRTFQLLHVGQNFVTSWTRVESWLLLKEFGISSDEVESWIKRMAGE